MRPRHQMLDSTRPPETRRTDPALHRSGSIIFTFAWTPKRTTAMVSRRPGRPSHEMIVESRPNSCTSSAGARGSTTSREGCRQAWSCVTAPTSFRSPGTRPTRRSSIRSSRTVQTATRRFARSLNAESRAYRSSSDLRFMTSRGPLTCSERFEGSIAAEFKPDIASLASVFVNRWDVVAARSRRHAPCRRNSVCRTRYRLSTTLHGNG